MAFPKRHELRPLLEKSRGRNADHLLERDGFLILNAARFKEPPSTAHSALTILALLGAATPQEPPEIAGLAQGMLRQKRVDGPHKLRFEDLPDFGEGLCAGEAMLGLLEPDRPPLGSNEPKTRSGNRPHDPDAYLDCAISSPPEITISTRRFRARPLVVALSAIGRDEPKPSTSMLEANTLCPMR